MSTERESDGIGELTEDLLRIAILMGTRLAQRHAQQRANRLEQATRQSGQARAREERIQALERDAALSSLAGVRSRAWWDHADADDIRRAWTTAREWQGQDPRAGEAVYRMADELQRRYGLDVRETDPSVLGEQGQIPAHTTLTVDELVAYDQRAHEQLERLAEQRAQLAGADPSLDPGAEQRLAQLHEQTVELTEIRDLIAEDLADRRQYEPEAPREQDVRERQERRELADAELLTGTAAAGIPPAVEAVDAAAVAYDTHERREQLRERLQNAGVPGQAVDARVVADTGQGVPAAEAVAGRGPSARARPAGRNPKGRAPTQQRRR
ncbi:MAG: hypothetical protein ABSH51_26695 [Solirubrobacteraceae bacterium]